MKILAGIVLFILLGAGVHGQQAISPKAVIEASAMSEKIVRGAPFSAEAVNDSVQVLADGNRIVRSSTNKLYRNSEGRFRREISGGSGGSLSNLYTVGPGTTILDPVLGFRYMLDLNMKTARVGALKQSPIGITGLVKPLPALPALAADKVRDELKVASQAKIAAAADVYAKGAAAYSQDANTYAATVASGQGGTYVFSTGPKSKYDVRTEDLGTQSIEGVEAVGTRTTTTIPAGDIGNERPIEIVYEKWYSNELHLVVMSKQNDPRFGEQTYRLTNIVRSEPEPSLFEVPSGFKVVSNSAAPLTITTARGHSQNVIYAKPQAPAAATTVKAAKP